MCHHARLVLRETEYGGIHFRSLHRAFTAVTLRGNVSVGALSTVVNRIDTRAALGVCSRVASGVQRRTTIGVSQRVNNYGARVPARSKVEASTGPATRVTARRRFRPCENGVEGPNANYVSGVGSRLCRNQFAPAVGNGHISGGVSTGAHRRYRRGLTRLVEIAGTRVTRVGTGTATWTARGKIAATIAPWGLQYDEREGDGGL